MMQIWDDCLTFKLMIHGVILYKKKMKMFLNKLSFDRHIFNYLYPLILENSVKSLVQLKKCLWRPHLLVKNVCPIRCSGFTQSKKGCNSVGDNLKICLYKKLLIILKKNYFLNFDK